VARSSRRSGGPGRGRGAPADPPAPSPPAVPDLPPVPPAPALVIDAIGRKCPIPIIWLAQRIREVPIGQTVAVLADDPAARSDIPAWCGIKSQEWLATVEIAGGGWAFHIRRSY
jgi:tRNA 2-thiouridine synthesizing protein A